jgi:hypothetical protein
MTTVQDHKSIKETWPATATAASIFLAHAASYLQDLAPCYLKGYPSTVEHGTYDDRKASQLLEATSDFILAEARIKAWFADLGFNGQCQTEAECQDLR